MSYYLSIEVTVWPSDILEKWLSKLSQLGGEFEFHPGFDPKADSGWLPVPLEVKGSASFLCEVSERESCKQDCW